MITLDLSPVLMEALRLADGAPCLDDPLWTSTDYNDLEQAAELCTGCPALVPCRAAGEREYGVWGGVIREPAHRYGRRKS